MLAFFCMFGVLTIGTPLPGAQPQPAAVVRESAKAIDPALDLLGRMVGGTWRTTGNFVAEFKYEWRIEGKAIRAVGIIAKGTKEEFPAEALYGWDPDAKKVYYLDFHGHKTIYKGLVESKDGKFTGEFDGIVGEKGHYRFEDEFTDNDTVSSTLFGQDKDGKWVKVHSLTFKRHR
jgi:hypothetical protein